ncbi:MAG: SagB/ThcOx family dehydrogenase [Thermaerobacter sp.]|nr:SagB/ThcOx family dehydrogenase [Thermaerobacter sp.]
MREHRTVNVASLVFGEEGPLIDDLAETYIEASKLSPCNVDQLRGIYRLRQTEALKHTATRSVKLYPHRPILPLPEPKFPSVDFWDILHRRRTVRHYNNHAISLVDLSTILKGSCGITGEIKYQPNLAQCLRTVPSGGALYPFEVYCVVINVEGITPGLYHYNPLSHGLEELRIGQFKHIIVEAACGQGELVEECAVIFILTGMFWRSRFKYGLRGFRFVLMEVGHLAQNLLLTAESLDMAAVLLGGFYDDQVNRFVGIDGVNEAPLYLVTIGYKGRKAKDVESEVF